MNCTDKERMECLLALDIAREADLNILDMVKQQARVEQRRKKMAEVSSAVELFLKDKEDMGIASTSLRTLRSIIKRFATSFDGRLLDEVTHTEIKQWLTTKGLSTRSKNGYLKEVKNLYNWSMREGKAHTNPANRISTYLPSVKELEAKEEAKEILTIPETRLLLKTAMEEFPRTVPRLSIMLFAGVRPDREAANITWDNLYMADRVVHVPASKAKDRRERFVKMCEQLVNCLDWSRRNGLALPVESWDSQWSELKNRLGLLGQWPNSCTRHTFASYSLMKYGEESTKDALGHGSYDMLFKHYRTLVFPNEAEEYFNLWEECQQAVA